MNKILTILVPVYNTELYIKRCLDSILIKEILDDIEVLVVSDGSKDKSVDIINHYEKKYPNTIRLIEKENGGHGSTINKGIENATGKYFKVLDSDDWFNIIDFVKFVKKLKTETADLVVSNYKQIHVYNGQEVLYKYNGLEEDKTYNFDNFNLELLNGEYFVMATSTYKLEKLKEANVKLLEKTFYVDMQYNIQPILVVNTFTYYNLDIYRYYIGRKEQSVNIESFVKNKKYHEIVMKDLLNYYKKNKNQYSKNKREYIEKILIYMLNTHYNIYCNYDKNYQETYRQIKEFDIYLKNTNKSLYQKSNQIAFLNYHRKTKFLCVKFNSKILKKTFNILRKIKHQIFRRENK